MNTQYENQPVQPTTNSQIQPESYNQPKKSGANKLTLVLCLLLLVAVGGLAYFYVKEKQAHVITSNQLTAVTATLEANSSAISESQLRNSIVEALQSPTDRECYETKSSVLFNVGTTTEKAANGSVKKHYGIAQYICSRGQDAAAGPIRFSVVQSRDAGKTWEFTYGSSTIHPLALPDYIYKSDPAYLTDRYAGVTQL